MTSDHNSNYYDVIDMIRAFSGRDNTIGIPRPLIKFMDSLEGGAFLSQLIYWSDKGGREDGWFYKTYPEWQEDIGLSEYEVRKWSKVMIADGYLETKVMRANGNPTVHYRLDMRKFSESFLEFLRNETGKSKEPKPKNEVSITEITAETTTRNKDKKTFHIEKPKDGFSRVSPEHPQAQQPSLSLDGLSVPDAENGSQHEKAKKPRTKRASTGNPNTQPILSAYQQAYEEHTGFSYTFPGFDKKAAKTLADAGYTPDQVVAAYKDLCSDPWWSKRNNISLVNVSTEIGGILKKLGYSPSRDGSSVPYQPPKPNYLTFENTYT